MIVSSVIAILLEIQIVVLVFDGNWEVRHPKVFPLFPAKPTNAHHPNLFDLNRSHYEVGNDDGDNDDKKGSTDWLEKQDYWSGKNWVQI